MRLQSRAGDLVQATRMTFLLTDDLTLEIFSHETPIEWCSPTSKNRNVLVRRVRATAASAVIDAVKQFLDELHGSRAEQPFVEWQSNREQIGWYWSELDPFAYSAQGLRQLAEHVAGLLGTWHSVQFEWHAATQQVQFVLFSSDGVIMMDFSARCFDQAAAECVVHAVMRVLTGLSECRIEKVPPEDRQDNIWLFNAVR